jgi:uncharacterized membrane protein
VKALTNTKKPGDLTQAPADLLMAVALVILTLIFTLAPQLSDLWVRVPVGLIMVLFLPGYALIAALFPRDDDLDGIERVALSFGLSIAVVPLIGLGLNYTPWGIRLTPVVVSLSIFTIALLAAAFVRRALLPAEERFKVPFRQSLNSLKEEMTTDQTSRVDKILTVVLVIAIISSIAALVYVIVTPKEGEKFTEFYILGPGGMAYDYPTKMVAGEKSTVIVGIGNYEYQLVNYTIHIEFNNATILEMEATLDHNETWEQPISYVLDDLGEGQKLQFLLYREGNFTAPYRDLHLWVDVSSRDISARDVPEETIAQRFRLI